MVWEFGYQSSQSRAHTGELLVQFAPGARAAQHKAAAASIGGTVREIIQTAAMEDTGAGELVRITIGNGLSAERAIEIVSKRSDVAFAEPNVFSAQATSNDPYYTNDSLWGMHGDYSGATRIEHGSRANEVWTKEYLGSTRVAVGIVDNGIHCTHRDLYLNVWINQKEIPAEFRVDWDDDGLTTFRDLNHTREKLARATRAYSDRLAIARNLGPEGACRVRDRLNGGDERVPPVGVDLELVADRFGELCWRACDRLDLRGIAHDDCSLCPHERAACGLRKRLPGLVDQQPA